MDESGWTELRRVELEAEGMRVDVVLSRAPEGVVLTLEPQGELDLQGETPGEYWMAPR